MFCAFSVRRHACTSIVSAGIHLSLVIVYACPIFRDANCVSKRALQDRQRRHRPEATELSDVSASEVNTKSVLSTSMHLTPCISI